MKPDLKDHPIAGQGTKYGPAQDPVFGTLAPLSKWLGKDWAFLGPIATEPVGTRAFEDVAATREPGFAADAVDWQASFGAVDAAAAIRPYWQTWELSRVVVPSSSLGVIEQVATSIDSIEALDEDGFAIYSYGPQNGQRPTLGSVLHPTPGVGRLEWQFRVTLVNMGPNSQTPLPIVAGPEQQGRDLVDPFGNCSQGSDLVWGGQQQRVIASEALVRLFVMLRGPTGRFRARIGGRLAGFTQSAGDTARALANATRRRA